jgi:hypothetical protein
MMDISLEMKNKAKMRASYYHRPYDNLVSSYALTNHQFIHVYRKIYTEKEKENIGSTPNGSGQQVMSDE